MDVRNALDESSAGRKRGRVALALGEPVFDLVCLELCDGTEIFEAFAFSFARIKHIDRQSEQRHRQRERDENRKHA